MEKTISKVKCDLELLKVEEKSVFSFGSSHMDEKITIYDEKLVKPTIESIFMKKYKRLLYIIMNILESDDANDSDALIVLDKINELREYLMSVYGKHIKKDELHRYLKMLEFLESKLVIPKKGKSR